MSITINSKENADLNELDNFAWDDDDFNINEIEEIFDNPRKDASNEENHGFNYKEGNTWLYPNNLPLRAYQLSITKAALFKNTLVVLPTGLGKTFIAAVVMYNIYRWYPTGKVIFMAPTRPLVAQQIEACKKIMPFPDELTLELTGKTQREKRMECWREKRVFFATPQALQADMMSDFPFQQVKLIVVDEAHRAKGRYAYVEVAQALHQQNKHFRVLALSATPGRTFEDVTEIVRNLFISHLEVRWDTSIDVSRYVHQKSLKTIVVNYSEEIQRVREKMIKIIDPYIDQLVEDGVISVSHPNISRNLIIMEQKRFRERQERHPQHSAVTTNFSISISLYHSLELLERHGLRVFLNSFENDEDGRPKFVLANNPNLRVLVEDLRRELGPNPFDVSAHTMTNGCMAEIPKDLDFGHPKFEEARKCILAHFEQHPDSRAIVFCEYRESVMMIFRLLLQHLPVLKPKCFVGQGGTSGALRALSQKQQIQIMNDFRAGKSNILIATSIGEEGIDVGEVDLIVCFDINTSNPTRFVQRIGRTGRQRRGQVIMLVTEGKEAKMLQGVLATKDQINKKLFSSTLVEAALYKESPRMIPSELNPDCVHIHVKPRTPPAIDKKKQITAIKTAGNKKTNRLNSMKKLDENTQDLRKFFKKHGIHDSDEAAPASSQLKTPVQITQRSMDRIQRIFKDIQPCYSSTQSGETSSTVSTAPTSQVKLDSQYLRKVNKFLKSSTDPLQPLVDNFQTYLNSPLCSKAAKLLLLQKNHTKVREICEQMEILQALLVEHNSNMSAHELEIRQTHQNILDLFENRDALQRFLEDAELDELAANKRQAERAASLNDWDMTLTDYRNIKQKIFGGLDSQGSSWDSFDYRQKALKQTKTYQQLIAEKRKSDEKPASVVGNSMVFHPMSVENTCVHTAELKDMTLENSFSAGDSKYCSQWESDFQPNRIFKKSTPIASDIKKQKSKQFSARNFLETVKEPAFESDNDDIIFVPLDNDVCNKKSADSINKCKEISKIDPPTDDFLRTPRVIEASLMQCQQSTPIQPKKKCVASIQPITEPSLQHELDLDFEQAFSEPFPEEIQMHHKNKVDCLSGSSLKENANPKARKIVSEVANVTGTSLFKMLESKPVNSILTPKRSSTITTPKINTFFTTPKCANITNKTQKTPNTSSENFGKTSKVINDIQNTPKNTSQSFNGKGDSGNCTPPSFPSAQTVARSDFLESPENRPQTSTKPYEKSPSIFSQYLKGMQRMENRRQRRIDSMLEQNNSKDETNIADNSQATKVINKNNQNTPKNTAQSFNGKDDCGNCTPPSLRSPQTVARNDFFESPKNRPQTSTKPYEKSPSIFSQYLKGMQRMESRRQRRIDSMPGQNNSKDKTNIADNKSDADSPLIRKRKRNAQNVKRQVVESDTETDGTPPCTPLNCNSDDDFEEIQPSPKLKRRCLTKKNSKPKRSARFCEFIDDEAEKSGGSGHSDEEHENSLGSFVCDSVVVIDDSEDDNDGTDAPTATQMQAVYLQSVKSPNNRRPGGFKIPAHQNYDIDVYSQAVPIEPSHYGLDSFVVHEDEEEDANLIENTLCPLEKAERILKEKRREAKRRRRANVETKDPPKKRARKCYQLDDSSDEGGG